MISSPNVGIKVYSITGALVADYYSNTKDNSGVSVELQVLKVGGLDTFSFTLANNFIDPLFNDMECRFFVDGKHWYSGYAEKIPELDSSSAEVNVEGRGFFHKLKDVIVNESYTFQTFDYILKDICSKYLGQNLNVLYSESLIITPTIPGLDVEFNDKKLFEVFTSLLKIANYDYQNMQYRFWVDKDKYFNFDSLSDTEIETLFEGYDYQRPNVETTKSKMINKVNAYRTTLADKSKVELVSVYANVDSIANYGEISKKITFPDYLSTHGIKNIAEGIISRYGEPITKISIEEYPVQKPKAFGVYRLINKRLEYFSTVSNMEALLDWDTSYLTHTLASISTEQVFTNRTSLKLVSSIGSSGDYMERILGVAIRFPTLFKLYAYRTSDSSQYRVKLYDTFGNVMEIEIGYKSEPINQWITYTIEIDLELGHALLYVDYDATNGSLLRVDKDSTHHGHLKIDILESQGLLNLSKIQIVVDSNTVETSYFDQFQVLSSSYKQHRLTLEKAQYTLDNTNVANLSFGDIPDNLIQEIVKNSKEGEDALSIFSKA